VDAVNFRVAGAASILLVGCCQAVVAEAASLCSLSDSLMVGICQTCFRDRCPDRYAECSEVRLCQMVSLQWLEPSASAFHF
jgi:hypothetical protein